LRRLLAFAEGTALVPPLGGGGSGWGSGLHFKGLDSGSLLGALPPWLQFSARLGWWW